MKLATLLKEVQATATVSKKSQSPIQWFADKLEEELELRAIPIPYKMFQKLVGEAKQIESEKATEDYNQGYADAMEKYDSHDDSGELQYSYRGDM